MGERARDVSAASYDGDKAVIAKGDTKLFMKKPQRGMKVSYSDGNLLLKNQDACARFYELQLRDAQYHYCPPRTGPEKVCDFENLGLLLEPDGGNSGVKAQEKERWGSVVRVTWLWL